MLKGKKFNAFALRILIISPFKDVEPTFKGVEPPFKDVERTFKDTERRLHKDIQTLS